MPVNLNLRVDVPARLFVRGRGLDSEWSGRLDITGPQTAPSVKGQINLLHSRFTYAKETGSHLRRVKNRITAVNFPEGLEDTGTWAFQGNNLSEIKIPSSVKMIGERTFCGNRNLEKIKFEAPSGVSELGSIEDRKSVV